MRGSLFQKGLRAGNPESPLGCLCQACLTSLFFGEDAKRIHWSWPCPGIRRRRFQKAQLLLFPLPHSVPISHMTLSEPSVLGPGKALKGLASCGRGWVQAAPRSSGTPLRRSKGRSRSGVEVEEEEKEHSGSRSL